MIKFFSPLLKIVRKAISILVRLFPGSKFVDFLIWPISKRLFGLGYVEIIQTDINLKMKVYGDMEDMVNKSLLFMSAYKKLAWEPATARLVKWLSKNIKVAVIAGSHIGYYPLIIGVNNPNSIIYAFEPNPINYTRFIENINLNNLLNVRPDSIALGDKVGEEVMFFDFGQSSFLESDREHPGKGNVFVTTLDHFFADKQAIPDIMIFDAEGYEPNIIKGGETIINKYKPDIIFEINPKLIKNFVTDDYDPYSALTSLGYAIYIIEDKYDKPLDNNQEVSIKLIKYSETYIKTMPFVNVFATINSDKISDLINK